MKILLMSLLFSTLSYSQSSSIEEAVKLYPEVESTLKDVGTLQCVEAENIDSVSDSLVKNLSCKTLTLQNVFSSLQEDAFSLDKQLPLHNWSKDYLGQCWGLALTQRRLFYLARFNKSSVMKTLSKDIRNKILDSVNKEGDQTIIKIDHPNIFDYGNKIEEQREAKAERIRKLLLSTPENKILYGDKLEKLIRSKSFVSGSTLRLASYGPIIDDLIEEKDSRSLWQEIEKRQKKAFYRVSNAGMVLGDKGRSIAVNRQTFQNIQNGLKNGRMPLIVAKRTRVDQHVYLVKKIEKISENEFELLCYDSINPGVDIELGYKDGKFYDAYTLKDASEENHVGVFLKDEEEMDELQAIAYNYYKELCGKARKSN
jgi:hypothetical protein